MSDAKLANRESEAMKTQRRTPGSTGISRFEPGTRIPYLLVAGVVARHTLVGRGLRGSGAGSGSSGSLACSGAGTCHFAGQARDLAADGLAKHAVDANGGNGNECHDDDI